MKILAIAVVLTGIASASAAEVCDKELHVKAMSDFSNSCRVYAGSNDGAQLMEVARSRGHDALVVERVALYTTVGGSAECTACSMWCKIDVRPTSEGRDLSEKILETGKISRDEKVGSAKCWLPISWTAEFKEMVF